MEGAEGSVKGGKSCWALGPGHSGGREGAEGEALQAPTATGGAFQKGATLMLELGILCSDTIARASWGGRGSLPQLRVQLPSSFPSTRDGAE